jgi:hypothetical protein
MSQTAVTVTDGKAECPKPEPRKAWTSKQVPTGDSQSHDEVSLVEIARVGPSEAEIIAARLRSEGISVTLGPGSPYDSLTFAEGVPVLVPRDQYGAAVRVLNDETGTQTTT